LCRTLSVYFKDAEFCYIPRKEKQLEDDAADYSRDDRARHVIILWRQCYHSHQYQWHNIHYRNDTEKCYIIFKVTPATVELSIEIVISL